MKIRNKLSTPLGQCHVRLKALLVVVVCFQVILACRQKPCPSKEVAEHIAKQFIFQEYSGDLYDIDLEITNKFMTKIKNVEYCVFEFNYTATLKSYFLRYETLERQRQKQGMQIAYIYKNGWYGTVIQRPQ